MRTRILVTALALVGAALLTVPAADEAAAQAGTKGAGAARTGVGPGTNAGDPSVTNATGPGANPITPAPARHRKSRHTTGSR